MFIVWKDWEIKANIKNRLLEADAAQRKLLAPTPQKAVFSPVLSSRSPCVLLSEAFTVKIYSPNWATMMTGILPRRLLWNGRSYAFTHKLAASTYILKNCRHASVIGLLQGRKGLEGIITASVSAFKIHTLLTVPSWQGTSGWKRTIRRRS